MTQQKTNSTGGSPLKVRDGAKISVGEPRGKPSLTSDQFDPFKPYKTDEEKYSYRALNIRPQNMRTRLAEGWETVPDSEYGDLILARLPKEELDRRIEKEETKTKKRTNAAVDQFKIEAEKMGVKTFEE